MGSGERGDAWEGVRGCHGVGHVNENGEALLSWCAQNEMDVMNMMFQKKRIHQYTWQHPGSKQWHCIDYVLIRKNQKRYCVDVSVIRSAMCWTDHNSLCAQLKVKVGRRRVQAAKKTVSTLRNGEVCERFVKKVCEMVDDKWDDSAGSVEMWETVRDSMVDAAEDTLGWERGMQPDWFREKGHLLKPQIEKRNLLFHKWLRSRRNSDRQRYVLQRREVLKAVKKTRMIGCRRRLMRWKLLTCLEVLKGTCGRV